MKTYIDLTSLYKRNRTGIENYAVDLYFSLKNNPNIDVVPIFRKFNEFSDEKAIVIPFKNLMFVNLILLPFLLFFKGKSVVLYPAFPSSPLSYLLCPLARIVNVIHDTCVWKYPDTINWKAKYYIRPLYNLALKFSKAIFTVSNTVKNELLEMTDLDVINTSQTINIQNITAQEFLFGAQFKEGFYLSVSTVEPRKNVLYLLKVYSFLIDNELTKKPLVFVGKYGWGRNEELDSLMLKYKEHIHFTGYVSDEELVWLYKNCEQFILLSLYEGFGRTPIEADYYGATVVLSDIPIFRETMGNRALFVPLNNHEEVARNIIQNKQINVINAPVFSKLNFDAKVNIAMKKVKL